MAEAPVRTNYYNTLSQADKLDQLAKCRFMDKAEFADGIAAIAGKKVVIVGCGAQGLNQGLNMVGQNQGFVGQSRGLVGGPLCVDESDRTHDYMGAERVGVCATRPTRRNIAKRPTLTPSPLAATHTHTRPLRTASATRAAM